MVMVPYNALPAELRTTTSARLCHVLRMVFSGIACILCAVLPLENVKAFATSGRVHVKALCFGRFPACPPY